MMKLRMIKNSTLILPFVFFLSIISLYAECPYVIHSCEIRLGRTEGVCEYGAAALYAENLSSKTITAIEAVFVVTDENGENPFIGGNSVQFYSETCIEPGVRFEMFISLDEYMQEEVDDKLCIRHLFFRQVGFEDGSLWKDLSGRYEAEEDRL